MIFQEYDLPHPSSSFHGIGLVREGEIRTSAFRFVGNFVAKNLSQKIYDENFRFRVILLMFFATNVPENPRHYHPMLAFRLPFPSLRVRRRREGEGTAVRITEFQTKKAFFK